MPKTKHRNTKTAHKKHKYNEVLIFTDSRHVLQLIIIAFLTLTTLLTVFLVKQDQVLGAYKARLSSSK